MRGLVATLLLWVGVLAGCDNTERPPQETQPLAQETERLNQWFDARFEEQLDFSPIRKTLLGRKDDYDEIDDFVGGRQDAQLDWYRATVEDLRQTFNDALLTPEAKISYDLWLYALEDAERAAVSQARLCLPSNAWPAYRPAASPDQLSPRRRGQPTWAPTSRESAKSPAR